MAQRLLRWAHDYLMQDHPQIARPYAPNTVCPYVAPSIKNDAFFFAFHREINGEAPEPILRLLARYAERLRAHRPYRDSEQVHKALLVVFPKLDQKRHGVLDVVHRLAKDSMVEKGLMIGQFHPHCRTPAAHNPAWKDVSACPIALIAMRFMAVHDLVFLAERKHWFLSYHERFGDRFANPDSLGPHKAHLAPLYEAAKRRFLQDEALAPATAAREGVSASPAQAIS